MSTAENALQSDSNGASSSLKSLKAECEKTWEEIKELQKQLVQCQKPHSSAQSSAQQPLIAILKEKERRLKAEIQQVLVSPLQTLPSDSQVISAALLEDFERETMQLKEILSLVGTQKEELKSIIEQEHQFEEQLLAVQERLKEKCQNLESMEPEESSMEVVTQELENKITAAQKIERTVMKKMAAFVGQHFPLPDQSQVSQTTKILRYRRRSLGQGTLPLKDILLELMTKCVESPNDPYILLDERYWSAYIELLLRCNIVIQHPEDDRRIKLVPFHL